MKNLEEKVDYTIDEEDDKYKSFLGEYMDICHISFVQMEFSIVVRNEIGKNVT